MPVEPVEPVLPILPHTPQNIIAPIKLSRLRWWRSATILCGSTGLGGAEAELPSSFVFGRKSKYKASRRQRLAPASRLALGGIAPPVKRSATPLFGLHESVAVTLKARAQRGTRVGRRPKDALAYVLRAGESRFLAAGRQVFAKDAKQDCGGCISVYR